MNIHIYLPRCRIPILIFRDFDIGSGIDFVTSRFLTASEIVFEIGFKLWNKTYPINDPRGKCYKIILKQSFPYGWVFHDTHKFFIIYETILIDTYILGMLKKCLRIFKCILSSYFMHFNRKLIRVLIISISWLNDDNIDIYYYNILNIGIFTIFI